MDGDDLIALLAVLVIGMLITVAVVIMVVVYAVFLLLSLPGLLINRTR